MPAAQSIPRPPFAARSAVRPLWRASLGLAIFLLAVWFCHAQLPLDAKKVYRLFPVNKACVCIKTRHVTPSVLASNIWVKKKIYQVFRDRRTKSELFRVEIGDNRARLWNYGVALEDDFNGDGVPDYTWYGGDDSGQIEYVFLSSGSGFRRLDILKTLQAQWSRAFHATAPDFRDLDAEFSPTNVRFFHDETGLTLLAEIVSFHHSKSRPRRLRVESSDFVFSDH